MALREIIPHWRNEKSASEPGVFNAFNRERDSLHRDLDRIFESAWQRTGFPFSLATDAGDGIPSVDAWETDKAYHIDVELPGVDADNIDVSLANGVLSIAAKREEEKLHEDARALRRERFVGNYTRSLSIPEDVDPGHVKAKFNNGILYIEMPRTAAAQKNVQRIKVTTGA
jgi:HSP20 family protein